MPHIKSTSTAVWWIKNPKKQRTQSWASKLLQDMTDLFRNISLHGYNKLFDRGLLSCERLIWLCVHFSIFAFMCTALVFTWDQFVHQHFSINLHDPLYPVEKVPFPAVSICSRNRISRQAAEDYARELSKLDPHNNTVEHFVRKIDYFRSLYYTYEGSYNISALMDFQMFLDRFATRENDTFYDIMSVMAQLTPSCKHFLRACTLGGNLINCDIFVSSLTTYGFCCTFNLDNAYKKRSHKYRFVSADMGLTVLLNTSKNDDTFTLLNMDGYAVLIHEPNDFPDIFSGGSLEVFPTAQEETFIALKVASTVTSEDLRSFSPIRRKCFFNDEIPYKYSSRDISYSLANCISHCRARSMIALCDCLPFYISKRVYNDTKGVPYCTLKHVSCIQQYQFKWRNVLTQRIDDDDLVRETEEGLYCLHCLHACYDVRYSISMMSLPMDRISVPDDVDLSNFAFNISDMSVLRVFFSEPKSLLYERVVTNTWVESLGTVGNILSICMGFSLVGFMEILFFLIKCLVVVIKKFFEQTRFDHKKQKHSQTNSKKLYICP